MDTYRCTYRCTYTCTYTCTYRCIYPGTDRSPRAVGLLDGIYNRRYWRCTYPGIYPGTDSYTYNSNSGGPMDPTLRRP